MTGRRSGRAAHHGSEHRRLGTPCVAAANANPEYRCPTCGLTLHQGITAYGRRAAQWERGHKGDALGQQATSSSQYHAQHKHCNGSHGASQGNRRRFNPIPRRRG